MPSLQTMRAGGTIRRSRFVKVYASADNQVAEADANEATIGISQDGGREAAIPSVSADPPEAAQAGDDLQVFGQGEQCLLELGSGGCTRGGLLKSDADGKGVAIASSGTTLQQYGARALQSGSEGELVSVVVLQGSVYPALA